MILKVNTSEQIKEILQKISMAPLSPLNFQWNLRFKEFSDTVSGRKGWVLWCEFNRVDLDTEVMGTGRGRDEIIWEGASESAVVKTCWVIIQKCVEHELAHMFLYRGRPLFDYHATVDNLWTISQASKYSNEYAFQK